MAAKGDALLEQGKGLLDADVTSVDGASGADGDFQDDADLDTCKPTAIGTVISTVLASALVVPCLKAGYCPSVSNLTIMPFTILKSKGLADSIDSFFVNLAQVAGTSGTAITSGIAFSYPAGIILLRRKALTVDFLPEGQGPDDIKVELGLLMVEVLAGTLMGSGLVPMFARMLMQDGTDYPMPEAHLCVAMLNLIEGENELPHMSQSLWFPLGLVASVTLGNLLGYLPEVLAFRTFTDKINRTRDLAINLQLDKTVLKLPAVGGIVCFGVGAVLPGSVVWLSLGGSLLNWVGSSVYLHIRAGNILGGWKDDAFIDEQFPDGRALNWTGCGAMSAAIVWTLVKVGMKLCRGSGSTSGVASDGKEVPKFLRDRQKYLQIPRKHQMLQWGFIAVGLAMHLCVLLSFKASWAYIAGNMVVSVFGGFGMTYLGALLSLQIGGGASPVSGTTLVLGVLHCINLLITVGSGKDPAVELELLRKYIPLTGLSLAMNCTSTCFANDAVQDFATIVLMRANMYLGIVPKLLSALPSCICVPLVLWLSDSTMRLGSTDGLPSPQASTVGEVLDGVVWGAPCYLPLLVGAVLGIAAVTMEEVARSKGSELPAMAFAVGLYLPPDVAVSMAFGYFAKQIGTRMWHKHLETPEQKAKGLPWVTMENSLCAAAFMTGYSLITLVIGMVMNVYPDLPQMLNVVRFKHYEQEDWTNPVYILPGLVTIVALLSTIGYNSYNGHLDPAVLLEHEVDAEEEEKSAVEMTDMRWGSDVAVERVDDMGKALSMFSK